MKIKGTLELISRDEKKYDSTTRLILKEMPNKWWITKDSLGNLNSFNNSYIVMEIIELSSKEISFRKEIGFGGLIKNLKAYRSQTEKENNAKPYFDFTS